MEFVGRITFYIIWALLLSMSQNAVAHSGRTDSSGCHTNRKTGVYHCHNTVKQKPIQKSDSFQKKNESLSCCKICSKGKACGDSCISKTKTCHKTAGCACDS